MLVKLEVASFAVDPSQNIPIVILKEQGGERTIPISVGSSEASAIAIKYLDIKSERPLTIDLVRNVLEHMGGVLKRIIIHDLVDSVFLAHLQIATENSTHIVDCRPSDAIGLALRCGCDIFIEEAVFEKNGGSPMVSEREKIRQTIANLDTLDFGRYYLK